MNRTLLGRLWAPIAKWFTILEMRLHIDIFRQQGLTPEDRLLHLDKHLRRNVLFEHIARETYHRPHEASTPITGCSRHADASVSAGSTTPLPDSLSPSTSLPKPPSRPMYSSCAFNPSGPRTSMTTTTPI